MTNRVTPYEAGWLTMLVKAQICTEAQAREAMQAGAEVAPNVITR